MLCSDGDLDAVKDALEKGKDVNETNEDKSTGLMNALRTKQDSVVELLLDQPDIDISCKDDDGQTALHLACINGNVSTLTRLLEMPGLDGLNEKAQGKTPLMEAVCHGARDAVRLLGKTGHVDSIVDSSSCPSRNNPC